MVTEQNNEEEQTQTQKGLDENELLWLCGFLCMESEDSYRHTNEERKQMKIILTKLRELKK